MFPVNPCSVLGSRFGSRVSCKQQVTPGPHFLAIAAPPIFNLAQQVSVLAKTAPPPLSWSRSRKTYSLWPSLAAPSPILSWCYSTPSRPASPLLRQFCHSATPYHQVQPRLSSANFVIVLLHSLSSSLATPPPKKVVVFVFPKIPSSSSVMVLCSGVALGSRIRSCKLLLHHGVARRI